MILSKNKYLMLVFTVMIFLLLETGCIKKEKKISQDVPLKESQIIDDENYAIDSPMFSVDTESYLKSTGEQIKKLSDLEGIDDIIISVNGQNVTRREFEMQKILNRVNDDYSEKDIIQTLINSKILRVEAEKLGVEPKKEDMDQYIGQIKTALQEKDETVIAYIEGQNISEDEFLIQQEDLVYDIFLRDALRQYMEKEENCKSFEEYVAQLIKEAKIKFYDKKIEKIYNK